MHKDKKTIKREILDKFRSLGSENDTLPPNWLEVDYLARLDNQEKKIFKQAIKELVSSGLVEHLKEPDDNLRLTQKLIPGQVNEIELGGALENLPDHQLRVAPRPC